MRGFPSRHRGFPGTAAPDPVRRQRSPRREAREPPEDERTHVLRDRFAFLCGARRIGVERAIVVLENPTCRACRTEIAARVSRAEFLEKNMPKFDW